MNRTAYPTIHRRTDLLRPSYYCGQTTLTSFPGRQPGADEHKVHHLFQEQMWACRRWSWSLGWSKTMRKTTRYLPGLRWLAHHCHGCLCPSLLWFVFTMVHLLLTEAIDKTSVFGSQLGAKEMPKGNQTEPKGCQNEKGTFKSTLSETGVKNCEKMPVYAKRIPKWSQN